MTVHTARGDLFESGADVLVNPCNCIGVSGAGLAKVFAQKFPVEQAKYERIAKAGGLELGELLAVTRDPKQPPPRHIVYFPTKGHWREQSRLPEVEEGLHKLRAWIQTTPGVERVAVPALGCGLGGLPWSVVQKAALRILGPCKHIDVALYEPHP